MVQRRKRTKKMGGGGCGCAAAAAAAGATQPPTSIGLGLFSGGGKKRSMKNKKTKTTRRMRGRRMRGGNGWSLQPTYYQGGLPNDTVIPYTSKMTVNNQLPSRLIGGRKSLKMHGGGLFSNLSSTLNSITGNGVTNIGGLSDLNSALNGFSIQQNKPLDTQLMGLPNINAKIYA